MRDSCLQRIILEEDIVCDYCDSVIPAGTIVFARFITDEEDRVIYPFYWCSQECLDSYEAEEFENELKNGLHKSSDDYLDEYGLGEDIE